jgi:hypothetical protein
VSRLSRQCGILNISQPNKLGWGETVHLTRRPLFGLLYQPRMIDEDECGVVGGMIGKGSQSTRRKTCPNATLSTTNPTLPDLGSNSDRRGKKAQRLTALSYGTASSAHQPWRTVAACNFPVQSLSRSATRGKSRRHISKE